MALLRYFMVDRNKGIKSSAHQIKTKYENNIANSYTMSWNTIRRSNRVSCTCNKTRHTYVCTYFHAPLNIYLYLCFVNICEKKITFIKTGITEPTDHPTDPTDPPTKPNQPTEPTKPTEPTGHPTLPTGPLL